MEKLEIELTQDFIKNNIYIIRGQKVMLDFDLAEIYGYETSKLNQQVKRNADKFPDDFMFQITKDELKTIMMSQNVISRWGGTRKLPYAFTEQGIYMLMTVLKGDLATKQSILIVRTFKAMKNYIIKNRPLLLRNEIDLLRDRVEENSNSIKEINNKLEIVMDNFIDPSNYKEYLIMNGEKIESDIAYQKIYSLAEKSIFIVDDYIGIKTLELLKICKPSVKIVIFSDNKAWPKLSQMFVDDFLSDRKDISLFFKQLNNRVHDRYIVIDYDSNARIFHCGASSKDGGNKITTIMEIEEVKRYRHFIDDIMNNDNLLLP